MVFALWKRKISEYRSKKERKDQNFNREQEGEVRGYEREAEMCGNADLMYVPDVRDQSVDTGRYGNHRTSDHADRRDGKRGRREGNKRGGRTGGKSGATTDRAG